ncbi:MAG TPA: shikimate dehydrogenase [Chthoniobacterales bacterium]|jgi:shikimate dehydrogenase
MKAVYTLDDLRDWQEPDLRYAVLGDPVAHSASPAMHNAALEHLGLPERYCRLHVLPEQLPEAISLLPAAGFLGVNLTIPHKTEILPLLDDIDPHSQKLGAVNTVAFSGGKLVGTNTDGPGIIRAVREEFGVSISNLRVLILGAGGGAGRAIATQCFLERCRTLTLTNRTLEKIEELATGLTATAIPWSAAALETVLPEIDLIINASAVGMKSGEASPMPASMLRPEHLVFDTIYVGASTPLQRAAEEAGARSTNGLSLLLHQGILALEFWLGREVPIDVMRAGLHNYVNAKH